MGQKKTASNLGKSAHNWSYFRIARLIMGTLLICFAYIMKDRSSVPVAKGEISSLSDMFAKMEQNTVYKNEFHDIWNNLPPHHVISEIRNKAWDGNPYAQTALCWIYMDGSGVEPNDFTAAKYCKQAADQGYAIAEYYMGYLYSEGRGVALDPSKANAYYQKAMDKGLISAKYNLSQLLQEHAETDLDIRRGLKLQKEAAQAGYSSAQFRMGVFHQFGIYYQPNPFEALNWYEKAADQGDAVAKFNIGVLYCKRGPRSMIDLDKCADAYAKSAEMGYGKAAYNLAVLYSEPMDGYVQTPDVDKANYWARKAAKLGESAGQVHLYNEWKIHNRPTVSKEEALIWLRAAAMDGDPESQAELGELYAKGEHIEKEKRKAAEWLLSSYVQGESRGENTLMILYDREGHREEFQFVIETLEHMGSAGNVQALNLMALMYLRANGVERSVEKAAEQYRKAAMLGDMHAAMTVAQMYTNGTDGLRKQPDTARQLYFNLVQRGDESAQYYLGSIYENGKGVSVDKGRAYMWYSLAGKNMVGASRQLANLQSELSKDAISRAKKQALICRLTRYKDRACQVI